MTSLAIACVLLALLLCLTIAMLAKARAKLRRFQSRIDRLEAQNAEAFEWGRSVGVAKGASGRWLRFETDELMLKHLDIVYRGDKHN